MTDIIKPEFEKIRSEEWTSVWRLPVFGGWLVQIVNWSEDSSSSNATFVPDPQHEWQIKPVTVMQCCSCGSRYEAEANAVEHDCPRNQERIEQSRLNADEAEIPF